MDDFPRDTSRPFLRLGWPYLMAVAFTMPYLSCIAPAQSYLPTSAYRVIPAGLKRANINAIWNGAPADDRRIAVQFVGRTQFAQENRARMRAFHQDYVNAWNAPYPAAVSCPQAQRYAQGILQRLIDGSDLQQDISRADYPVALFVTCGVMDFPDAIMKAGVLEISAELMLAMPSEDEIAAVIAHELAHYTLAHDAKKLEVHARLSPYAAIRLAVDHEYDADAEGLALLVNAGYDPDAAADAMMIIRAILHARSLQTDTAHPDITERIRSLQQHVARRNLQRVPRQREGLAAVQAEIRQRPAHLLSKREGTIFPF